MNYEEIEIEELRKIAGREYDYLIELENKMKTKKKFTEIFMIIFFVGNLIIGTIGIYKTFDINIFTNVTVLIYIGLDIYFSDLGYKGLENEINELQKIYYETQKEYNEIIKIIEKRDMEKLDKSFSKLGKYLRKELDIK